MEKLGEADVFPVLRHFIDLLVVESWPPLRQQLFLDKQQRILSAKQLIQIDLHARPIHDSVRDVVFDVPLQPLANCGLGLSIIQDLVQESLLLLGFLLEE